MLFSSVLFLFLYLPVVLGLYYLAPFKWRNALLLVANLIFYGWGEPAYTVLMLISILINYVCGLLIERYRTDTRKARFFLLTAVVLSLGLLVFFKYYDFLAMNLSLLPGLSFIKPLGITLPIGISFYTFQTMSYTIDVYRGDTTAQRNIIRFGTYVSLFAQLIAGPIVRYQDVAAQLSRRDHTPDRFASGIQRFVVGLAKKVFIANNLGLLWDTICAADTAALSTVGAWLGILAYAFQIYFDFAGYSDMAIGLGRMFGFEFLENFDYPYISRSITEFWRRWHISLGTWFREYVYIPLGGNRRGLPIQLRNLLIVWALTGIWHGASWNFLLWGIYYAFWLILEKLFLLRWLERIPRVFSHVYALLIILVGWALFAITDIQRCLSYLSVMFGFSGAGGMSSDAVYYLLSYLPMLLIAGVASTPLAARLFQKLPQKATAVAAPVLILVGMAVCTAYLVDASYNPFLYFRF